MPGSAAFHHAPRHSKFNCITSLVTILQINENVMNELQLTPQEVTKGWTQFIPAKIPTSKTLLLLGEAPGAEELASGLPFTGAAGRLLRDVLLPQAGLDITQWNITNVFTASLPPNDLKSWTLTKTDYRRLTGAPPPNSPPPLSKRYLHPDHHWHLHELASRLATLQPDFIICLGATAYWAITGASGIANGRGTIFRTPWGAGIATYHPAAILREWSMLPFAWADLNKARQHLEGTLPAPLRRTLWYNPTLQEIAQVYHRFRAHPEWTLGVDIETAPSTAQITTISFGTPTESICIPLWDRYAVRGAENYWPTVAEERAAWRWIERFCQLPNPKVFQHGIYDLQYMLDAPIQLRVAGRVEDTAILAHALQPELQKSLGTLASLHLNEPSWKQMRAAAKDQKQDE